MIISAFREMCQQNAVLCHELQSLKSEQRASAEVVTSPLPSRHFHCPAVNIFALALFHCMFQLGTVCLNSRGAPISFSSDDGSAAEKFTNYPVSPNQNSRRDDSWMFWLISCKPHGRSPPNLCGMYS